jgi:hypothetical protein
MNSEEIKANFDYRDISGHSYLGFIQCAGWLKEIAYQLAVMNERSDKLSHVSEDFGRLVKKELNR